MHPVPTALLMGNECAPIVLEGAEDSETAAAGGGSADTLGDGSDASASEADLTSSDAETDYSAESTDTPSLDLDG